MQATFYGIWLALYIIPFTLIVVSPGHRSFFLIATVFAAVLGFLHWDLALTAFEDRGWSYALTDAAVRTMVVGAAAGLVARGITLAKGWRRLQSFGLATTTLAVLAAPIYLAMAAGYDQWQRRPPATECVARTSFDLEIAAERISVPNWPLVMVSSGAQHFALSTPTGQRRLCERASDGVSMTADSVTFFFDHVTFQPLRGDVGAWADRECGKAPDSVAASLVCGDRPIEQLTIYADADFPGRTTANGRISSHAFFLEQQSKGRYVATEALQHPTAREYPDGNWAFDDGTVFVCRGASNGGPTCRGDVEVAPGLLAKVEFKASIGDVEAAQRKARQAVLALYADISAPPSNSAQNY